MKLRLAIIFAVVPAILLACSHTAEKMPNKRESVIGYFENVGVVKSTELRFAALKKTYASTYVGLPASFWAQDTVVDWFNSYKEALLQSYVDLMVSEFSDEELQFLIQFYETPDGKRVVKLNDRSTPAFVAANSEVDVLFANEFVKIIQQVSPCQLAEQVSNDC